MMTLSSCLNTVCELSGLQVPHGVVVVHSSCQAAPSDMRSNVVKISLTWKRAAGSLMSVRVHENPTSFWCFTCLRRLGTQPSTRSRWRSAPFIPPPPQVSTIVILQLDGDLLFRLSATVWEPRSKVVSPPPPPIIIIFLLTYSVNRLSLSVWGGGGGVVVREWRRRGSGREGGRGWALGRPLL